MSVLKYTIASSSSSSSSSWDAGMVDGHPWLYFGSLVAAENHDELNKHNVRMVLTVASARLPVATFPDHIEHIRIDIDDHPMANFLDVTEKCREVINKAAAIENEEEESRTDIEQTTVQKKKKILVHCASGISRSSAAVLVWLMDSENLLLSLEDALAAVRKNRPLANPNHGFIRQLRVLEKNGGKLSDAITEWKKEYSDTNAMESVANQRINANEIHADVDEFEENVQTHLSAVSKQSSCNNNTNENNNLLLKERECLLEKANELSHRLDTNQQHEEDAILMDKPAKIILKSARNKFERLFSALAGEE